MLDYPSRAIAARLLLLGVLMISLNLAAQPHQVYRDWAELQHALHRTPLNQRSLHQAHLHLFRLAERMPWRVDLWHAAGIYALWAGEWDAGLKYLSQIDFNPLNASEWLLVGDAYASLDQFEPAENAWQQSARLKEDIDVYKRFYELHQKNADYDALLTDLQNLTRLDPASQELFYQRMVYLSASDPQQALDWLDQAPELDPSIKTKLEVLERKLLSATLADSPAVQILISGQGLADIGEWQLALLAFQRAAQLEPAYPEAWAFLGEARQQVDPSSPEIALNDLQYALNLDPNSISAVTMLALYWQRQGDWQRASDLFQTAVNLQPENPAWLAALGGLSALQGDLQTAESYYLKAVAQAPRQSTYYNLLANFYILNQIQIREKALPASLKAVEIDPENPISLTTLAQVYLLLDEQDQGIQTLNTVLQKNPDFARAHYVLGMAYLYRGQSNLAYDHLSRAIEYATDSATLDQAQRALRYYFP